MSAINGSSSMSPQYLENLKNTRRADATIANLRDAMGMEVFLDETYIDGEGKRRGLTGVRSKGGKEAMLESAEEMQKKIQELQAERLEEQKLEEKARMQEGDRLTLSIAVKKKEEEVEVKAEEKQDGAEHLVDVSA